MGSGKSGASAAAPPFGRSSSGLGVLRFVLSMFVPESRRFAPQREAPRHGCARALTELHWPRERRRGSAMDPDDSRVLLARESAGRQTRKRKRSIAPMRVSNATSESLNSDTPLASRVGLGEHSATGERITRPGGRRGAESPINSRALRGSARESCGRVRGCRRHRYIVATCRKSREKSTRHFLRGSTGSRADERTSKLRGPDL